MYTFYLLKIYSIFFPSYFQQKYIGKHIGFWYRLFRGLLNLGKKYFNHQNRENFWCFNCPPWKLMKICIKMWMKTCFHSHFYAIFHASATLLLLFGFSRNFHQNVGLRNWRWYTPLFWEVFAHFFNWGGADIRPQIRPRKIPVVHIAHAQISFKHPCWHFQQS